MFMGEYNHTIDAKGRLIIPSKFRESLGEEFVITKGLDGCLFVYDNQEWNAFEEKLKAFMTESDSKLSGIKQYADHRSTSRPRRRG